MGATRKPLELVASGGLGAGAGLARRRCPWTMEGGQLWVTDVSPAASPPPPAAHAGSRADRRGWAGPPAPGRPPALEGHFRPRSPECGERSCTSRPCPGRRRHRPCAEMRALPGKEGTPLVPPPAPPRPRGLAERHGLRVKCPECALASARLARTRGAPSPPWEEASAATQGRAEPDRGRGLVPKPREAAVLPVARARPPGQRDWDTRHVHRCGPPSS